MSRYIKSVPETVKLTKGLENLQEEFRAHKQAIQRNNKELAKVNERIELEKEKEIKALQEKLKKLEMQTQWVENSEPAVKVTSEYMLKKLDIL